MKRTALMGIAILVAPLAGCAWNPLASLSGESAPKTQASAPDLKQLNAGTDLESAIRGAQNARKAGDFIGATKMLSQLVLVAPDDARVLGEYGKTLAGQGRSDEALAFLERATQLQPGDWTLFSAQGVAYDQKGNYQTAQAYYARALTLKPGEPTVLNNNALSHMQAGDLDGAERLLREATPGTPDYPRIAQNLALVQSLRAAQPAKAAIAAPAPAPVIANASAAAAPPPAPVLASLSVAPVSPVVAAAPVAVAPAPAPVVPAPADSPAIAEHSVATRKEDAPIIAAAPAMAPLPAPAPPAPVSVEQHAAPRPAETPVTAIALAPPAPKREVPLRSRIEVLKADPTVQMQPVPVDEPAPLPRALTAKQETEPKAPAKILVRAEPTASSIPALHPSSASNAYYVQAGAFSAETRAEKVAATLGSLGARVSPGTSAGHAIYRVRIGPFLNIQQAKSAITQAQELGQVDLGIVTE